MTTSKSLIAEIKESLKKYSTAGLLDDASMYRWIYRALKTFGQSICVLHEKTLEIRDGKTNLPPNFHSLLFITRCDWMGYHCDNESKELLQHTSIWKERVENYTKFNPCDPCCIEYDEKIVTEKIYYKEGNLDVYYGNHRPLRISKHVNRDVCAANCKNLGLTNNKHGEVSISEKVLYTDFPTGAVTIQYYGVTMDEEELPIIPDTPRGFLEEYVEYHVKRKSLEDIVMNGDDTAINILKHMFEMEKQMQGPAVSDAKFMSLTPESYRKINRQNKIQMAKFESLIPSLPTYPR